MAGGAVMRVGLLAYGLERPLSGVTRVALELGRALRAREDVDVFFLRTYREGAFDDAPGAYLPGCRLLPGLMALGGPLIARAARRLRLDVVHDPIGVSPFTLGRWAGSFRRVVTIHDAIAFEYPRGYPLLNNLLHRAYVPWTLRNVDLVVTDSLDARRALERHLGLAPESTAVVPLGVSPALRPVPAEEARAVAARHGLDAPYVLYVGALQARKNVPRLLDAFALARERAPDLRLALVGPSPWAYPEMRARLSRSEAGVRPLGTVSDAELAALYSGAAVFVLPSLYEGFGMPVLEAMACGAPVVCSAATSLPEVAADAALLVDPRDPGAIADAIVRLVRDPALAAELRAKGRRRAAEFTWARTAGRYVELYRATLMRR